MRGYLKNLFAQLRVFVIADSDDLTEENLVKAVTLNENLKAYGYTLKPADIVRVAKSKTLDSFYEIFKSLQNEVKAAPMYPDFPKQVMNLPEAQFRMHQAMHYFSTYGMEFLFGTRLDKAWYPDMEATEKTKKDVALLEAKTIELISEDEMFSLPLRRILEKKERMTLPEMEIVKEALKNVDPASLDVNIPFKENLEEVFCVVADNSENAVQILERLCQHTGDVWRCLEKYLGRHKYRLTTSQKKLMVKLFESYPVADFQANLIITNAKSEKVIRTLEFLSFNRFSRSAAHKEAVRKLRNKELKSWQGQVDYLLSEGKDALDFISQRPGMLVRLTARLLRNGYNADEIAEKLVANASALSMQTLLSLLNFFGCSAVDREDAEDIYSVMLKALRAKMKTLDTPFKGKKVCLEEGDFSLDFSRIEKAAEEGGYVRAGLAYKIPDAARRIRFFVYWNDFDSWADVDLHVAGKLEDGENVHVGWNGDCNAFGMVHSGDITEPDAAEYIDIDMENTDVDFVNLCIHLYGGAPSLGALEECFVGVTAVNRLAEDVAQYDPKNCFFSHDLKSKVRAINYGSIDVTNRVLIVDGKETSSFGTCEHVSYRYPLRQYLEDILASQDAEVVAKDEAEVVLVMGKPNAENEISIIDSNFFCD